MIGMIGMIGRGIADAACAETQDALLLDAAPRDAAGGVRVERHLERCAACQQTRARLEQLRNDVHAGAPALDDVRRARLLARLAPVADGLASRAAARGRDPFARPRSWAERVSGSRWAVGGAVAAVAAIAVLLSVTPQPRAPVSAPAAVATTKPAVVPDTPAVSPPAPGAAVPAIIRPYRVTGSGGKAIAAPLVGRSLDRLQAPAATAVRARFGERTDATLVGPGAVSVLSAVHNVLDVELQAGTLVVDFDHGGGGRLRIHSPGAITEVVGTLLAVEVRGDGSRVSVSRGRVVVQPTEGPPRVIAAGQSWATESARPTETGTAPPRPRPTADVVRALPVRTAALMAEHDGKPRAKAVIHPFVAAVETRPAAVNVPAPIVAQADADPAAEPAIQPPPAIAPPATIQAPSAVDRPIAAPPPARPAPATAPAKPALTSTEEMYRAAEGAMGRRDWTDAQHALEQIIAARTGGPLEDVARYELAQLALRQGALPRAAFWLDKMIASDREPALREPARFLRCEIHLRAGETTDARQCLESFRTRYPASVRDGDVLGALIRATPDRPCETARPLATEYLRRYPSGAEADRAQRLTRSCPP